MERCDVAIVGAGPYGLTAAAHLRKIRGLEVRLFGEPMSFWERHMPAKMLLRSPWIASSIGGPTGSLSLGVYRDRHGLEGLDYPVPVEHFIRYGRWFLQQTGIRAEGNIARIDPSADGFQLTPGVGGPVHARRVVVAGGIQPFAYRPDMFRGLPAALVTHTSEQRGFDAFGGKDVMVIGAGQSALEAAGFMRQAGARVDVLVRNHEVRWLGKKRQWLHSPAIRWMLYGKGDIGPAGVSLVVQRPNVFRRLPRQIQEWWGSRAIRPAVFDRLMAATDVTLHAGRYPIDARVEGPRVRIYLNDGTDRAVDHVVLGTGYRVDISRYPFFTPALVERIERVNGYPVLDAGFETTARGLHVLGAPAAWSFGPLMRFVAGTEFAGRALERSVARAARRSSPAAGRPGIPEAEYGNA
jgi:cation diffusion facilitator CzcD-associated flavoprotein CzcO